MKIFKSLLTCALLGCASSLASAADDFSVLVFSKTNGFRHHDAIATGKPFFQKQGELHGFKVKISEDPAEFTSEKLKEYQVIVLLNTTGAFLKDKADKGPEALEARKAAFAAWVKEGGAILGLHSATDCFWAGKDNWPTFHKIIGGSFQHHPHHQVSKIKIVDANDPSVKNLTPDANPDVKVNKKTSVVKDGAWIAFDEWYNFHNLQRDNHVILAVDDSTCEKSKTCLYEGGAKAESHPFAWTREYGKGKIFYTSRGHYGDAFADIKYAQHVIAGLFTLVGKPVPTVNPASLPTVQSGKKK